MATLRQLVQRLLIALFVINLLATSILFGLVFYICQFFLSPRATHQLSCAISWLMGQEASFIGGWLCDLQIVTYGSAEDEARFTVHNHLINMNHTYELDFMTAWLFGAVFNVGKGAKVCLKEELKRVPILGKVWQAMGYIFLAREWNKDKENLDNVCSVLNNYPCPYVVLIFCEGTRFTEAKLESSNEYARTHGMKELKYHLIPRTRGFLHILNSLRSSLDSVYDVTVRMEGPKPSVLNLFSGATLIGHCHYRRFSVSEIPKDNEEVPKWLVQRYEEKDELVAEFKKNGCFPGDKKIRKLPIWSLLVSLVFLIFYTLPILYGLVSAILSLPPFGLYLSAIGITLACGGVCYKIWGYTRLSKASEYGLNKSPERRPKKSD